MQNVEIGIGNRLKCMPQSWKNICSRKITQSGGKTYFLTYTHLHAKMHMRSRPVYSQVKFIILIAAGNCVKLQQARSMLTEPRNAISNLDSTFMLRGHKPSWKIILQSTESNFSVDTSACCKHAFVQTIQHYCFEAFERASHPSQKIHSSVFTQLCGR